MISAVIIEDEPIFQEILLNSISKSGFDIQIDAVCKSKREAKKCLPDCQPQLVFLDVELSDGKGIDLLNELPNLDFEIIFTTSHDKYAINAIKKNAADYLLKPIQEKELKVALGKVIKKIEEKEILKQTKQLQAYIDKLKNEQQQNSKILVPVKEGMIFLPVKEIIRLESKSNYTVFHLINNKKEIVAKTLKSFEEKLLAYNFMRIHQSHLVNLLFLKEIDLNNYIITLSDGSEVEIAKRKKKEMLELLKKNDKTIA
ncbi:MAG: LytTR family DNA-binding domain-containing protein [Chitinophagales bacterium]